MGWCLERWRVRSGNLEPSQVEHLASLCGSHPTRGLFDHSFRRFARAGAWVVISVREVICRWCGRQFCVCQSCWREQAYCSESCRKEARRKSHREAQRNYRSTKRGREAHRLSEQRRRMGRAKKTVDDQSSIPAPVGTIVVHKGAGCCRYCGRVGIIVERFPRRGYGGGRGRGDREGGEAGEMIEGLMGQRHAPGSSDGHLSGLPRREDGRRGR